MIQGFLAKTQNLCFLSSSRLRNVKVKLNYEVKDNVNGNRCMMKDEAYTEEKMAGWQGVNKY